MARAEGDVEGGKLVAGSKQGVNIQPLDLGAIDDQIRDLHQQLAKTGNI